MPNQHKQTYRNEKSSDASGAIKETYQDCPPDKYSNTGINIAHYFKFFKITATPEATPRPEPRTFLLPCLHQTTQEKFIEAKSDHYNSLVSRRREQIRKDTDLSAEQIQRKLKDAENQTIKGELVVMMKDLSKQIRLQMHTNNRDLSFAGLQKYTTNRPYELDTSNFAIAQNLKKSPRTVRRLLDRALICGFLIPSSTCPTGRQHTGSRTKGLRLLINPEWLLIYDLMEPELAATAQIGEGTVKCAFPEQMRSKCPGNVPFKSYNLNNSTKAVRNPEKIRDESNTAVAEKGKRGSKGKGNTESWKFEQEPANFQGESVPLISDAPQEKGTLGRAAQNSVPADNAESTDARSCEEPRYLTPLQEIILSYAKALMRFSLTTYYKNETIFEGAQKHLVKILFSDFFKGCRNADQVSQRADHIKAVIQSAADHMDKKPHHRFAMMPVPGKNGKRFFFDLNHQSKGNDYSGFTGVERKLLENKENAQKAKVKYKKKATDKAFLQLLHRYEDNGGIYMKPSAAKAAKLLDHVEKYYPNYKQHVETYLQTGKKPKL